MFWQYQTTGGIAPGVSGDCDLDRWMGNLDTLNVFAFGASDAGSGSDAGNPVIPDAGPITVDSGAPPNVVSDSPPSSDSGCGCTTVGVDHESVPWLFAFGAMGALGALMARRRRRF
jgi:MYXO-CTERM domain-containing protein